MAIISKEKLKESLTQKLSRLLIMEKEHKQLVKKYDVATKYIKVLERNSITKIYDGNDLQEEKNLKSTLTKLHVKS